MNFFIRQAEKQLGWTIERPAGAFYLWASIPDDFEDSHAFADYLLEHADVVVTPGGVFGAHGRRHVRISMVAPIEQLALLSIGSIYCRFAFIKKPAYSGFFMLYTFH